jgi:hypothetical protein
LLGRSVNTIKGGKIQILGDVTNRSEWHSWRNQE